MTEFIASNGLEVGAGHTFATFKDGEENTTVYVGPENMVALKELFRHEEDERLGRWRDPEKTDRVVSEIRPGVIHVYNEKGREYGVYYRADRGKIERSSVGEYGLVDTAKRFFDAHPVPKPAWHDAKPGEVWVLTVDGAQSAFYPSKSMDRYFTPVAPETGRTAVAMDSFEITDGRCIYPEDAS